MGLRETAAATRQIPRPAPGSMPEPRTHGAVWWATGTGTVLYTLQRWSDVLARITLDGETVHVDALSARRCECHHIAADVAAVCSWISRGGR